MKHRGALITGLLSCALFLACGLVGAQTPTPAPSHETKGFPRDAKWYTHFREEGGVKREYYFFGVGLQGRTVEFQVWNHGGYSDQLQIWIQVQDLDKLGRVSAQYNLQRMWMQTDDGLETDDVDDTTASLKSEAAKVTAVLPDGTTISAMGADMSLDQPSTDKVFKPIWEDFKAKWLPQLPSPSARARILQALSLEQ